MSTDFWPKMTLKASTERNQIPLYFIMRVTTLFPCYVVFLELFWRAILKSQLVYIKIWIFPLDLFHLAKIARKPKFGTVWPYIPGIQWGRTLGTRSCRSLPGPLWAQRPGSRPGFCSVPPPPRLWRAAPWISSRSGRGESVGTGWRWPSCPLAAPQLEWRAGALDIARCGHNLFSFSICLLSIPLPLPTSIWFRFWSFASLFRDGGRGKITDFTLTKIKCAFSFLYVRAFSIIKEPFSFQPIVGASLKWELRKFMKF